MPSIFMSRMTTTSLGLVLTAGLGGCFGGLSIEEQTQRLSQAKFSPTTRYAVVARDTNIHEKPSLASMQLLEFVPQIAKMVEESLGIKAEALPHGPGTPWWGELERARKATGMITTSGNDDFFRKAGYDGYVMITLYGSIHWIKEPLNVRWFLIYKPVFHIISLSGEGEGLTLMQVGTDRMSCESKGALLPFVPGKKYRISEPKAPLVRDPDLVMDSDLIDPQACVDRIVKRFKKALDDRH